MKTIILAIVLAFQAPNLIPIMEEPIDDVPDAYEEEGVQHFADSAVLAGYWKDVYRNDAMVNAKMKSFNTQEYNYVRLVYVGNCNTRVNYSLQKVEGDKELRFNYKLFEMGASPCRSSNYTIAWLKYPKQEDYTFKVASGKS